jgi:DNA-binding CsgD family transcriptional regulator
MNRDHAGPPPAWAAPASTEVMHGFTLGRLHALARIAAGTAWSQAADYDSRLEDAWYGVAAHLAAAARPPAPRDLVDAGRREVDSTVSAGARQHGQAHPERRAPGDRYGDGLAPRFRTFWWDQSLPVPSCESRVVERLALAQIWPRLSQRHREALAALAASEDYDLAAAAMGVTRGTFNVHVSRARKEFLALWHEHEQPSRAWGTDRRRGNSGSRAALPRHRAAARAINRRQGRPEHEAVHGRASTYTSHGCRCPRCTRAATEQAAASRRAAGVQPRNLVTPERKARAQQLRAEGLSWRKIGETLGISEASAIRAVNGSAPARAAS